PVAVRYPRGTGNGKEPKKLRLLETGKSKIERVGRNLAVIAVGKTVYESLSAAEILDEHGISLEVINARFVKPLDEDMLRYAADKFDTLITVEDGQIQGGFGSAVLEFFAGENISINTILHGIPDKFIEHATQEELYADLGLDGPGIARKILNLYGIEAKIEGYKPESVKKS
ncbi:MAG: transketolase C-terminal domain-containing protein, partial [Bacteroidota bacterium]